MAFQRLHESWPARAVSEPSKNPKDSKECGWFGLEFEMSVVNGQSATCNIFRNTQEICRLKSHGIDGSALFFGVGIHFIFG